MTLNIVMNLIVLWSMEFFCCWWDSMKKYKQFQARLVKRYEYGDDYDEEDYKNVCFDHEVIHC